MGAIEAAAGQGELHEEYEWDRTTEQLVIRTIDDVEPVLDANREAALWSDGYTPSRDLRRVARIPLAIVHKWLVEEGINALRSEDWPRVRRKLNDPEYLYLRTSGGRL